MIEVREDSRLTRDGEKRYVVIEVETGKIVDDAQGYGYKSKQKAYAAYSYKTRDRSKDREKEEKKRKIRKWMRENRWFVEIMDRVGFEIAKGSYGIGEKMNSKVVKELIKENRVEIDFSAGDLLKEWRKGKY